MTDATMASFSERIRREKPGILFGYATSVYRFAKFIKSNQMNDITFNGVFSTAEMLPPGACEFIEDTFRCRVFNRYGTIELGGVACDCEAHTGLHISVENNHVEILSSGSPVKPGEMGDVIVTNLNNLGMPIIRYEIGDLSAWYTGAKCPCGREIANARKFRRTDWGYFHQSRWE